MLGEEISTVSRYTALNELVLMTFMAKFNKRSPMSNPFEKNF